MMTTSGSASTTALSSCGSSGRSEANSKPGGRRQHADKAFMDEQVSDNVDDRERRIWYLWRKLRRADSAKRGTV
jgi:hypothetical protein